VRHAPPVVVGRTGCQGDNQLVCRWVVGAHSGCCVRSCAFRLLRGRAIAWCSEISVDRADVCCCAIPCQVGCGIANSAQFLREVSAGRRSLVLCYAGLAFLVEVGPGVVCQICCFRLANRARKDFVLANLFLGLCLAAILTSFMLASFWARCLAEVMV
jgi:hypothetical protein